MEIMKLHVQNVQVLHISGITIPLKSHRSISVKYVNIQFASNII